MKNIRAIACILIILGAVLVEISYKLLGDTATDTQFRHGLVQQLLPAIVGLLLLREGIRALLRQPGSGR